MRLENNGKALPILSFPCTSLLGVKTDELVHSAELQAKGMKAADFPVIYHNCGNNTIKQAGFIFGIGAAGYHFGNAISMREMLAIAPKDVWIMGNIDPAGELANGTPESVRAATLKLMEECCPGNPNFIVSSGCDIPPHAPWANLDAFFAAVRECRPV